MSRPSSGKKQDILKNQSKLIIISKQRANSAKGKGSIITVEQGEYTVQLNMGQNGENLNKTQIDKTIKNIEKSVEMYKNQKRNSKELPEYMKVKTNSDDLIDTNNCDLEHKKSTDILNEKEILNINENTIKTNRNEEERYVKSTNINVNSNINTNINNPFYQQKVISPRNLNVLPFIIFSSRDNSNNDEIQIFEMCIICERTFPIQKLYTSNCKIHKICRKCIKNYYEDIIEQGERNLKCPIYSCKELFKKFILKQIISENHYNLLDGKPNIFTYSSSYQISSKYNLIPKEQDKLKLYTQKHVLDINSNENFFMFNKAKNQFCPNCGEPALFTKIKGHFIKCLNCFHRICKYCMKGFEQNHMDIASEEHCKVYYRIENDVIQPRSCCMNYLIQLFFIISSFIFMFIGGFLTIRNAIKWFFCVKNDTNCFLWLIIYFFTIIFFICAIPIILIILPYFPIFTAIFN